MVIKLGILGISEGNGHPYSFSAIINGYSDTGLKNSGWPVIYNYVRQKDLADFGIEGAKVTHAWTQDREITKRLCTASLIPNMIEKWEDMIGQIDAVIIARDDYETHFSMAMPFLGAGGFVFVDKPLALNVEELKEFHPFLENGQLMSCSGMRYAGELDSIRSTIDEYGHINLVRCTAPNSWEKYGVHMLDAIFNIVPSRPVSVMMLGANHTSAAITMNDGSLLQIDCLGRSPAKFSVEIWGSNKSGKWEISDNFTMFRRTLWHFINSVRNKKVMIPPRLTIDIMRILIAGRVSKHEQRQIFLDEIQV